MNECGITETTGSSQKKPTTALESMLDTVQNDSLECLRMRNEMSRMDRVIDNNINAIKSIGKNTQG